MISRARIAMILLFLSVLGVAMPLAEPTSFLEVKNLSGSRVIRRYPASPGDVLVLSYTHSIYGSRVHEIFLVDNQYGLVLTEIVTDSVAVAEYSYPGRSIVRVDGNVSIRGFEVKLRDLHLRVDLVGNHTLIFKNEPITLYLLVGNGDLVRVRITTAPRLLQYLMI